MKFRFLGTGTSTGVPILTCECAVCQSTDPLDKRLRTSGLLMSEETTLVFDTGPDFRQQMLTHQVKQLHAVVFTHQHKDHTAGLDDVRPFNYLQRHDMDVYATPAVQAHLHKEYYYIFERPDYPGIPKLIFHTISPPTPFQVRDITLQPIHVMHGDLPVLGYRCGDFAYVTDTNFIPPASMDMLAGLDILVLDALQLRTHYSHFTLDEALEVVAQLAPKQTYLTHMSHHMGLHSQVNQQLPPGVQLAYDGLLLEW